MHHTLHIKDLVLHVALGCEAAERAVRQEVRVSVELRFRHPLRACETDRLGDTICYADLCAALKELVAHQEFHLIEKLGMDAFKIIQKISGPFEPKIGIQIHKVRPPVADLMGGSVFTLQDFSP